MSRRRTVRTCSEPKCPHLTDHPSGKCDAHLSESRAAHDATRPGSSQRGYGSRWAKVIRPAFLARHPVCALCSAPSTVPDHWPVKRRDLVAAGVSDPDADHRLRPLCTECHNSETAKEARAA